MKLRLLKIALGVIIIIGFYWLFKILYLDIPKPEGNPFNPSKIATQNFLVESDRDTILTTNSGSLIVIHENSFVNSDGKMIDGDVELIYKEILTKKDIIYSGLTTLSYGRLLESGGMINIRAFHAGQEIFLDDSSKIGFAISSDIIEPEMQLFKGKQQQDVINWVEPEPLLNDTVEVFYTRYDWNTDKYTREEAISLGIIYQVTLTGDRIFADLDEILSDAPELDTNILNQLEDEEGDSEGFFNPIPNEYKQSLHQKYVFELFELGWANIDRFYNDEKAIPVDFNVRVVNQNDYGDVFVRLCFKSRNIQIGANEYQDNIFTFKPFGKESPKLPIGEEVILIASASKDGKMFIDIKSHQIKAKQTINMSLKSSDQEQLERMIGDKI